MKFLLKQKQRPRLPQPHAFSKSACHPKYFQNCALQMEHLALKALHKKKERKIEQKKHFSLGILHLPLPDYFLIAPPSPSLTKRFRPLVEQFK